MQMMNGHLIRRGTQSTRQGSNACPKIHFAFDRFLVGTKGTFEAFGQGGAFFGLDLMINE
jgi:hypothetical protein